MVVLEPKELKKKIFKLIYLNWWSLKSFSLKSYLPSKVACYLNKITANKKLHYEKYLWPMFDSYKLYKECLTKWIQKFLLLNNQ